MIELFKIIKGMCVFFISILLNYQKTPLIRTRGNRYKLTQHHCNYDLRKYSYTNRVIPIWNSTGMTAVSDYVVSAETVNTFKRRLVKFWYNQDVLYNYKKHISVASETVVL